MPNHVTNRLNLIGEQTRIDELLDRIKNDELGRGTIDFNKIIPMPEALDVESGSVESDAIKAYLKAPALLRMTTVLKSLNPKRTAVLLVSLILSSTSVTQIRRLWKLTLKCLMPQSLSSRGRSMWIIF